MTLEDLTSESWHEVTCFKHLDLEHKLHNEPEQSSDESDASLVKTLLKRVNWSHLHVVEPTVVHLTFNTKYD
jgi:hypothetical protein